MRNVCCLGRCLACLTSLLIFIRITERNHFVAQAIVAVEFRCQIALRRGGRGSREDLPYSLCVYDLAYMRVASLDRNYPTSEIRFKLFDYRVVRCSEIKVRELLEVDPA